MKSKKIKMRLTLIALLLLITFGSYSQVFKEELTFSGTGDLTMSLGRYKLGTMIDVLFFVDGGWAQDGGVYQIAADWGGDFKVIYRGESSITNRIRFYGYIDPASQGYGFLFATWDNQSPGESHTNTARFTLLSNGDIDIGSTGSFAQSEELKNILVVQSGTEYVGVGVSSPKEKLNVDGSILIRGKNLDGKDISYIENSNSLLIGWNRSGSKGETNFISNQGPGTNGGFDFRNYSNNGSESVLMKIEGNGATGIGTSTIPTGYKLAVDGKTVTEEIKVEVSENWPDYVFSPEYSLKSLEETETYIKENHRLPDMPSAEEVAEHGIELGEMNRLVVEKLEELTLHLIDLKKENEQLKSELSQQQMVNSQSQLEEKVEELTLSQIKMNEENKSIKLTLQSQEKLIGDLMKLIENVQSKL